MEKSGKLGESDGRTENKGWKQKERGTEKGLLCVRRSHKRGKKGEKRKKEGEKWTTSGKQG